MEATAVLAQMRGVAGETNPSTIAIETLYATAHWLMAQARFAEAAATLRFMLHRAPRDARPWLALGECSEQIEKLHVALELYGTGAVAVAAPCRLHLARARVLRKLGRDAEGEEALAQASAAAEASCDAELQALVHRCKEGT